MAESQVPYDYAGNEASIIENLSKERFAPYLKMLGLIQNMHLVCIFIMHGCQNPSFILYIFLRSLSETG